MTNPFDMPEPTEKLRPHACHFCGQSPCGGIQPLAPDNSCYDCTDGAHPAWWRGESWGSEHVAKALLRVAKEGKIPGGRFGGRDVEEAALEIDRLRQENAALRAKLELCDVDLAELLAR